MCEIHRLTTNTCLTQVLIFKYHKVMNKIPLSGFCLLLKSRHKHLFRIMRITYMLLGDYIQLYTIYIKQKPDND